MKDTIPPESEQDDDITRDAKALSIERVLEILEKGDIDSDHQSIRWSSNYTFLTSVTYEDEKIMAVYKPQSGERPLWDFPDGTLCFRERAAFLVSHDIGWQLVPPTVLRTGTHGLGSLQFFIDHDPNYHYFEFNKDKMLINQLANLSLFDAVINNADRKGGHCIIDGQRRLWAIDHGVSFHVAHKLRTVIWDFAGEPIPDVWLDDIELLMAQVNDVESKLYKALCELLSEAELQALSRRMRRLLKQREYPHPGPGPNYPWPPV